MVTERLLTNGAENDLTQLTIHNKGLSAWTRAHLEIHEGEMWHFSHKFAALADSGTVTMRFRTAAKYVNMAWDVLIGGQCDIVWYEGAAYSNVGTLIPIFNRERNGSYSTSCIARHTSTTSGTTTTMPDAMVPGGNPGRGGGGSAREDLEWILLPYTNYHWAITNNSGGALNTTFVADYYEEEYI